MGAHWKWLGYGSVDALVAEARSGFVGTGQINGVDISRKRG